MKKQILKNKVSKLLPLIGLLLILTSVLIYSCKNGDENKLVPANQMVDVLTELYIADGVLSNSAVKLQFSKKDSVTSYIDILQKHGLSKTRMDRTMKYYFEKKPKELEIIYDKVLSRLSERETLLNENSKSKDLLTNLWNGPQSIAVPEAGINNSGDFIIPVKDTGNYFIAFTATVYVDDQSINPRAVVYFFHADTSKSGHKDYWQGVSFTKDSQQHSYTLQKRNTDPFITHICGKLLDCDPKQGHWEKHAILENIVLRKMEIQ